MTIKSDTQLAPQLQAGQWEVVLLALRRAGPWEVIDPVITALSQQLDAQVADIDRQNAAGPTATPSTKDPVL